jgi:hypothetical protein
MIKIGQKCFIFRKHGRITPAKVVETHEKEIVVQIYTYDEDGPMWNDPPVPYWKFVFRETEDGWISRAKSKLLFSDNGVLPGWKEVNFPIK